MASDNGIRDLELLLKSRYPLICLQTPEDDRAGTLLDYLADRLGLPFFLWTPTKGLRREDQPNMVYGTDNPITALEHIDSTDLPAVYHFRQFSSHLAKPAVIEKLIDVAAKFSKHDGAIVFTMPDADLPKDIERLVATVTLAPPSDEEYLALVKRILQDVSSRMRIQVKLDPADAQRLLKSLKGCTLMEAQKVLTKVLVTDQKLTSENLSKVLEAKKEIIERDGVLEYYPRDAVMADIAGLRGLKDWLRKRAALFSDQQKARQFGLEFPKGILLLGVQGCGKSLCAKAIAQEWGLPLLKLDPSNLYHKYIGESEKNLKRAIQTAEAMAPLVLWIDEIEKAFAGDGGSETDGGLSQRIFGTLLTWLQEKKAEVFVVATSNDISKLPPELVRKGRFDEIFFVDLPRADVRKEIFGVHLSRKNHDRGAFDLDALSAAAEGFTGAEIEQAVISALYTAFSGGRRLSTELILREIEQTRPLSRTMEERIRALRDWASGRTIPAD